MVKFKKELEARKGLKWFNEYINYKSLKRIINETYIKLQFTGGKLEKSLLGESPSQDTLLEFHNPILNNTFRASTAYQNNALVRQFIDTLEKEIKKFYECYTKNERELLVKLNTLIYNSRSIKTLSISAIFEEFTLIYILTLQTRQFNDYVFMNLEAIRKITKKFDKKIKKFFVGKSLMVRYIKNRLNEPNGDLNYIIQNKIVDQLYILIDYISTKLNNRKYEIINQKQNSKSKKNLDYNTTKINSNLTTQLNEDVNDDEYTNMQIKNINKSLTEIQFHLVNMDINGRYTSKFINMGTFFGFEKNLNKKELYSGREDIYGISKMDSQNMLLIRQFVTPNAFRELIEENFQMISEKNLKNLYITFANSVFGNILYMMNVGMLLNLFKKHNWTIEKETFLGTGIAITSFGSFIGKRIFPFFLKNEKNFKFSLLISSILIAFSSLIQFFLNKKENYNLCILAISRFIMGIGISGKPDKLYIMKYTPQSFLYFFIQKYDSHIMIGSIFGLFIGGIFNYYFLTLMILPMLILIQFLILITNFSNPSESTFSVFKKNLNMQMVNLFKRESFASSKNFSNYSDDQQKKYNDKMGDLILIDMIDKNKIDELNKSLGKNNEIKNISNVNLISKNICRLVYYFDNSQYISIIILSLILFTSHFMNMSLLIYFPISPDANEYSSEQIIFLMIVPFILYFIFSYIYNKLLSKEKCLKFLLSLEIYILFIMLCFFISDIYLFSFFYIFLTSNNLIIKKKIRRFISMTNKQDIKVYNINANIFIEVIFFLSTIIGCIFPLAIKFLYKDQNYNFNRHRFITYILICLILVFFSTILYNRKIDYIKSRIFSRMRKIF